MPKSRNRGLKPKQFAREQNRVKERQAIATATRIRLIVGDFTRQSQLDSFLLQEKDPARRQKMFQYVLPFIKFENPTFPTDLIVSPGLVGTDGRSLT